jgi:hypothetical protein
MNPLIYLDAEFTDLLRPELLSLGMVTADGHEHYVELDLADAGSATILQGASDFVRYCGVLEQWDRVPGSAASYVGMGERTARWLLDQATRLGQPAQVAFDYATDFVLVERLLRDTGHWEAVRDVVLPLDVGERSGHFDEFLGAEAAYEQLRRRGLERHHALADAHALRAACIAIDSGRRVKL